MTQFAQTSLVLDHQVDHRNWRHFLNGHQVVLHCHHYAALFTQLADDCELVDGKKLLRDSAEDAFYPLLTDIYTQQNVQAIADRIALGQDLFAALGLGRLTIHCAGVDSGEASMSSSHIDQAWLRKWGQRPMPVNFVGQGYLAALFAAVYGRPVRSYTVNEYASIVAGAEQSLFAVVAA